MADFRSLLESIAKRPGMYVGQASIRAVGHFLEGYDQAVGDLGSDESPLSGWNRWLEARFLICSPAWHWTRILAHACGGDVAAIRALPVLYPEFRADRARLGVEELDRQVERRIISAYGEPWHEPEATCTTLDDWLD